MARTDKPPTRQALQALAAEIGALETRMETQAAARAGQKIFDRVYHRDLAAFQSRDSNKGQSLLVLAELLDRSVARVWGLVAVAIVYDDLPSDLRDRLKPGHLEALYGATDIERKRLAREAVAAGHTVLELRARVKGEIVPDPPDPKPVDRSSIARAERTAVTLEREVDAAPAEQRPEIARRLDALIERLVGIRGKL